MAVSCGLQVRVPGVFSSAEADTGRSCLRLAGHDGRHRWAPAWVGWSPDAVEEAVAAAEAAWDDEPDDEEPASG